MEERARVLLFLQVPRKRAVTEGRRRTDKIKKVAINEAKESTLICCTSSIPF